MEEPKPEVAQEKPKASVVGWVEPSNCLTRRWSGLEYQFCERIRLHCLSSDSFLPCNIIKSRNGCGCGRTKWRNPKLKLRRRSQRPVLLGGSSHPIV